MRTSKQNWTTVWGETLAFLHRRPRLTWIDFVIAIAVAGMLYGMLDLAAEWSAPHRAAVEIDLSPWSLPEYTFFSLTRGLIAYCISLGFTLIYGYWAAKDELAARLLIPLLDILQSIPVLAFLPGLLLALDAAFPRNNVGLEIAAILMIFTGQAWNMTFSFYHSIRAVPQDQTEAAAIYRFNWWQKLKWVELPFATMGLVWNSMMSMAGGWFFLMINEAYQLGDKDFRLPGIGSYMQVAVNQGRVDSMVWAMAAMLVMIVGLDQLLWRPVVVWAQKFRVEEGGDQGLMSSWLLEWLRGSRIVANLFAALRHLKPIHRRRKPSDVLRVGARNIRGSARTLSILLLTTLFAILLYGAWKLALLLGKVSFTAWGETLAAAGLTLVRVVAATAIGTLWAVPAGLAIGLSPKLARLLQPVVQVAASFPAPMLFPLVIGGLHIAGVSLNFGAVILMLLGTQWYILFNVIAGAMAIPSDLREAGRSFRLNLWQRLRALYLPAMFPYLVTGWVTAAGGAWNASIVAEYVTFKGDVLQAAGLGAVINHATSTRDFPRLAAGVLVMAVLVVMINRLVWRRLYELAEHRFSLSK